MILIGSLTEDFYMMTHFRIIFSTKSRAIFDVFKFGAIFESIFKEERLNQSEAGFVISTRRKLRDDVAKTEARAKQRNYIEIKTNPNG